MPLQYAHRSWVTQVADWVLKGAFCEAYEVSPHIVAALEVCDR